MLGGQQPPDTTEPADQDHLARPGLDAFLEAKLTPPAVRSAWIPRHDLIRQLDRATASCALTLLAAPAGYGKTTLIAQWLAGLTGRRQAWVALDSDDLDPVRLWTHIVTALQRAGCTFTDTAARVVAQASADLVRHLLPTVVNAIADLGEPLVLVLDDFHFLQSEDCHEQVSFLLQHLPSTAALVISTRADPALRLGRSAADSAARRDPGRPASASASTRPWLC